MYIVFLTVHSVPDDYCDGRRNSHTLPWTDRGAVSLLSSQNIQCLLYRYLPQVGVHNSSRIISQHVHYTAKDQEIQKLMRQIKVSMYTAKIIMMGCLSEPYSIIHSFTVFKM